MENSELTKLLNDIVAPILLNNSQSMHARLKLVTHEVMEFNKYHKTEFVVLRLPNKTQIMHIDALADAYQKQALEAFKETLRLQITNNKYLTAYEHEKIHA